MLKIMCWSAHDDECRTKKKKKKIKKKNREKDTHKKGHPKNKFYSSTLVNFGLWVLSENKQIHFVVASPHGDGSDSCDYQIGFAWWLFIRRDTNVSLGSSFCCRCFFIWQKNVICFRRRTLALSPIWIFDLLMCKLESSIYRIPIAKTKNKQKNAVSRNRFAIFHPE